MTALDDYLRNARRPIMSDARHARTDAELFADAVEGLTLATIYLHAVRESGASPDLLEIAKDNHDAARADLVVVAMRFRAPMLRLVPRSWLKGDEPTVP